MKDDNLPPDNETVEDGGGCYVAGSREESIQEMDDKFADAAKKSIAAAKEYNAVNVLEAELTRLRSELQQKDEAIREMTEAFQLIWDRFYDDDDRKHHLRSIVDHDRDIAAGFLKSKAK